MSVSDFRQIRQPARKSRTRVRIIRREGLPFFLYRYRKRKLLPAGMAAGILLMLFLSAFIWDIQIQGNQAETKEELIRFLEDEGVYFGTWKERIDCRELAASMRRQFKNFTWVSVKIQGTQLCIDVQENKNIAETDIVKEKNAGNQTSESGACQDLVSDVDGIVESIFTRRGIPHVKNGMEVKKGDILVSGQIPVVGDDGEVAGYLFCQADADVQVRTSISIQESFPMVYEEKSYTGRTKTSYAVYFGKQKLSLSEKKMPYEAYDVETRQYPLCLGDCFYLPAALQVKTCLETRIQVKNYTISQAEARAEEELAKKIEKIQEKGVQIFENNVRIDTDAENCVTAGTLTVVRSAGVLADSKLEETAGIEAD